MSLAHQHLKKFFASPVDEIEVEAGVLLDLVALGVQVAGLLCPKIFT